MKKIVHMAVFLFFIDGLFIVGITQYYLFCLSVLVSMPKTRELDLTDIPDFDYTNLSYKPYEPVLVTASYYGCYDEFNLKVRADGGIFNEEFLSAAHVAIPFGETIRIISPYYPGRLWVDVVVNDSGPFDIEQLARNKLIPHSKRQLDLSCEAAKRLGFYDRGIGHLYVFGVPGGFEPTRENLYADAVLPSSKR